MYIYEKLRAWIRVRSLFGVRDNSCILYCTYYYAKWSHHPWHCASILLCRPSLDVACIIWDLCLLVLSYSAVEEKKHQELMGCWEKGKSLAMVGAYSHKDHIHVFNVEIHFIERLSYTGSSRRDAMPLEEVFGKIRIWMCWFWVGSGWWLTRRDFPT